MPQSLESSRGVGISRTDCLTLSSTASARMADELLWNKTTPNLAVAVTDIFKGSDHSPDVIGRGKNAGRQADGAFWKGANCLVGRRRAVQANPSEYPELVVQPQANLRDAPTRHRAGDDGGHGPRVTRSIHGDPPGIPQPAQQQLVQLPLARLDAIDADRLYPAHPGSQPRDAGAVACTTFIFIGQHFRLLFILGPAAGAPADEGPQLRYVHPLADDEPAGAGWSIQAFVTRKRQQINPQRGLIQRDDARGLSTVQ